MISGMWQEKKSCAAPEDGLWVTPDLVGSLEVTQNNPQATHRAAVAPFGTQVAASGGLLLLSPEVMPSINYYQG
jgi:hypothetical protein